MTRRDALQLALMASENRAANMLSRYYPGGKPAFVDAMNRKAAQLGMSHSAFVEGTGLASANVASASDLVKLVYAAKRHSIIRELSTQANYEMVDGDGRVRGFHTTNRLIANPGWDITLQKTGFINAAGQCLVMATNLDGRPIIMVFLDSAGKLSRLGDAQRVREWLAANPMAALQNQAIAQLSIAPARGVGSVVEPKVPAMVWSKTP
jgi:D-alanyl-D-alanine endopeptidase (penicillin-binding protein 7)